MIQQAANYVSTFPLKIHNKGKNSAKHLNASGDCCNLYPPPCFCQMRRFCQLLTFSSTHCIAVTFLFMPIFPCSKIVLLLSLNFSISQWVLFQIDRFRFDAGLPERECQFAFWLFHFHARNLHAIYNIYICILMFILMHVYAYFMCLYFKLFHLFLLQALT